MSSTWNWWLSSASGEENQNFGGKLQPTAIPATVTLNNSSGVCSLKTIIPLLRLLGGPPPTGQYKGVGEKRKERLRDQLGISLIHLATSEQMPNDTWIGEWFKRHHELKIAESQLVTFPKTTALYYQSLQFLHTLTWFELCKICFQLTLLVPHVIYKGQQHKTWHKSTTSMEDQLREKRNKITFVHILPEHLASNFSTLIK